MTMAVRPPGEAGDAMNVGGLDGFHHIMAGRTSAQNFILMSAPNCLDNGGAP
jgi:hypothetical protein